MNDYSIDYKKRCQLLLEQPFVALMNAETQKEYQCVMEGSDFAANYVRLFPRAFEQLLESGFIHQSFSYDQLLADINEQLPAVANEEDLLQVLRLFRNRAMLRIIWRDLSSLAPLSETMADLSNLADICIRRTYDYLYQWAIERYGIPRDEEGQEQSLMILAMGKLGARELNLSSDIDLIFGFSNHGYCDGRKQLDNETFFTRLGRKLINALNQQTADGFVFRVDMRLRPYGDSGPLVSSYQAMEAYYFSQARDWERYAMVKVRAITGSENDIAQLNDLIRPFVYRRYLDFSAIESIRDMKKMIDRELLKKGMDENIKLGRGGIREIEFIGQAYQLIRGGRDKDLQIRPIQQVLSLLASKQLLEVSAVDALLKAYEFLRLTENRIQAWRDQQTHLLFSDDDGKHRLARLMGFSHWASFYTALEQHRSQVQKHFDYVFHVQEEEAADVDELLTIWQCKELDETHLDYIKSLGLTEPQDVFQLLSDFKQSSAVRLTTQRGKERLDLLVPMIIREVASFNQSNATLTLLLGLVEAITRRTTYLDLLVENSQVLRPLVQLAAESSWLVRQLSLHPLLLDELLDSRRLYSPLESSDLQIEVSALLKANDDLEQEMELLRQFAHSNRMRVAAADIVGAIPLTTVSRYLSEIADVVVQQVLDSAFKRLVERYGTPTQLTTNGSGFAVIAYGKLGGKELGYGSDLDIVFLHSSDEVNAMTRGERSVANEVFFSRLGQRVIHMLSTRTTSGVLYESDMRLRPNGNSGMLVSSLTAFSVYQHDQAWVWEHQALLRARAVAGDIGLMQRFAQVRREVLVQPRDGEVLRESVLSMRQKMRESLDKSNADYFHIKQAQGCLVDIEFIVQYVVLRWANRYPELIDYSDNLTLLAKLAEFELLTNSLVERLQHAYGLYRGVAHRLVLQEKPPLLEQSRFLNERQSVIDVWKQVFEIESHAPEL